MAGAVAAVSIQSITMSIMIGSIADVMTGGKIVTGIRSFFSAIISPSTWLDAAANVFQGIADLVTNPGALLKVILIAILSSISMIFNVAMMLWDAFQGIGMIKEIFSWGPSAEALGAIAATIIATAVIGLVLTLVVGAAAKWVKKNASKMRGSGPGKGMLEVSNRVKSTKAVQNWDAKEGIEYIFDPHSERFIMGKGPSKTGYSPHERLVLGADIGHQDVVGGMISRRNGMLQTNEHSGHYGKNWTPQLREKFVRFMQDNNVNISHTEW